MKNLNLILGMVFLLAIALFTSSADTLDASAQPSVTQAGLLPALSPNFSVLNVTALVLGFVLYFVLYFHAYNKNGFSLYVWFKDNWYNLFLITPLCMFAFFLLSDNVSKWEAFALGVVPNLATDWILKMIQTKKSST